MAHSTSISAGVYSDMSIHVPATALTSAEIAAVDTQAEFKALFATEIQSAGGSRGTNTFVRIKNVREFPALGTPANIVKVPVFGAATSQQIQGQSDAPTLELKLNYVPSDWSADTILGAMVGDGKQYIFRFALLGAKPIAYHSDATTPANGIGSVPNSQFFWVGKVEALMVTPSLTDANQSTLTLTIQSDFKGAYTE